MKKHYLAFVALAATALATSCATDELEAQQQEQHPAEPQTVTLTASVDGEQTRVGMKKESSTAASFYWHKGDKILVQTKKGDGKYTGTEFTTEAETGATSATFTGEVKGTVGQYAVYPSGSHAFTSATALTYHLPAEYTYTTVGSNVFSSGSTYPVNSTNMPMLGTISDGKISFKHLGGLAVIRIDQMPVSSGTLTVTANEKLSGDFTVEALSAADAKITTETATTDADKHVAFTFSNANKGGVGVFYLPLATGSYSGVRFEIKDKASNTWWMASYGGTLSIVRAGGTAVTLSAADMGLVVKNGDGTYTINDKYRFIDLGLSVLWSDTNIGTDSKMADGNYFAWGETNNTKADFSRKNYIHYDATLDYCAKYYDEVDDKTVLEAEDDAATTLWGIPCRIPTKEEVDELMKPENCTLEGLGFGYRVTSIDEDCKDHYIVLPASGYYSNTTRCGYNSEGSYWTSSSCPESESFAYAFTFSDAKGFRNNVPFYRFFGCPVRPVAEKPIATD